MRKCTLNRLVLSLFLSVIMLAYTNIDSSQSKKNQSKQSLTKQEYSKGSQFVRAYFTDKKMAHNALKLFEVEALEISYDEGYIVLDVTPEDIKALTALNFVIVPDPEYDIHHNRSSAIAQDGTIPGYPSYRIVEKTFEIAESLCTVMPDFAEWIDVGDSWEKTEGTGGYDIMVLRLTNSKIEGPKPKLFITGSIHAREYTTSELILRFVLYLVENYGKNADVTWMLDYQEFHALFYANPDGRKHAEEGELWRKNTNYDYCASNPSKRGCDLNRNFDQNWSASSDECGQTFSGASGASEPETQAVQNYLQQEFSDTDFGIYIDLHSYGGIVMNPSTDELEILASKLSHFNGYSAASDKRGMTINYAYYIVGVASYLFELGTAFFQDCNTFEDKILPDNIGAFEYAFRVCRSPLELPSGPDALEVTYANNVLNATIDDEKYGGSSSAQNIAAAEYYIGIPPWVTGATPVAMEATDGSFDDKAEEVTATISMNDFRDHNAIIYVRGKDADDNWGPVSATVSDLTNTNYPTLEAHGSKVVVQYPNPLSLPATINVKLPQSAFIRLFVHNLSGRVIATLANNIMGPGEHSIRWNGKDDAGKMPAKGIYLFRLHVNDFVQMGKIILVK